METLLTDGEQRKNSRNRLLSPLGWSLLTLPIALHCVLVMCTTQTWTFNKLDILVSLIVLTYFAIGLTLARFTMYVTRFFLATYTAFITFAMCECILGFFYPYPMERTPHGPADVKNLVIANTLPGINQGPSEVTINSRGVRGPETLLSNADFRILCIGGSTTECWYVSDKKTWPALLQQKLEFATGKKIIIDNAGVSGHFSRHHAFQIENYKFTPEYDLILILCGFNDSQCFQRDNYTKRSERVPLEALTPDYANQAYYRRWASTRITRKLLYHYTSRIGISQDGGGAWVEAERQKRQRKVSQGRIEPIPANLPLALRRYEEDLALLIAACRKQKTPVVFMTQPTIYQRNLPQHLEDLLWMATVSSADALQISNLFNDSLIKIGSSEGVDVIDLGSSLPIGASLFYDDCHFNDAGCQAVAQIVHAHLIGNATLAKLRKNQTKDK